MRKKYFTSPQFVSGQFDDQFNPFQEEYRKKMEGTPDRSCCDFFGDDSNKALRNTKTEEGATPDRPFCDFLFGDRNEKEDAPSPRGVIEEAVAQKEKQMQMEMKQQAKAKPGKSVKNSDEKSINTEASHNTAADWIAKHMRWDDNSLWQDADGQDDAGADDATTSEDFKPSVSKNASPKQKKAVEETTNKTLEQMFSRLSVMAEFVQTKLHKQSTAGNTGLTDPFCDAAGVLPTKSFFDHSEDKEDDTTAVSFGGNSLYSSSLFGGHVTKAEKKEDNNNNALSARIIRKVSDSEGVTGFGKPVGRGAGTNDRFMNTGGFGGGRMAPGMPPGADRLGSIQGKL